MKDPTFAPAFCSMYPVLSEIARSHGYALMVHGTMQEDFDLLAVPWTDEAVEPTVLVTALAALLRVMYDEFGTGVDAEPTQKPHGRLAWNFFLGNGSRLDFGVMPRQATKM